MVNLVEFWSIVRSWMKTAGKMDVHLQNRWFWPSNFLRVMGLLGFRLDKRGSWLLRSCNLQGLYKDLLGEPQKKKLSGGSCLFLRFFGVGHHHPRMVKWNYCLQWHIPERHSCSTYAFVVTNAALAMRCAHNVHARTAKSCHAAQRPKALKARELNRTLQGSGHLHWTWLGDSTSLTADGDFDRAWHSPQNA